MEESNKQESKIQEKSWIKKHPVWSGIIGLIVLFFVIGILIPSEETEPETIREYQCADNTFVSNPEDCPKVDNEVEEVIEDTEEEIKEVETEESEVEEKSDKTTIGEKNALDTALSYLDYSAFSYSGLIEQLEYEGYTHEEAVYGVDNCGANWNEQAALNAQSYLDYSAFSREGLIEQLEFEGFTREQAEYGVQAVGY